MKRTTRRRKDGKRRLYKAPLLAPPVCSPHPFGFFSSAKKTFSFARPFAFHPAIQFGDLPHRQRGFLCHSHEEHQPLGVPARCRYREQPKSRWIECKTSLTNELPFLLHWEPQRRLLVLLVQKNSNRNEQWPTFS